MNDESMWKAAHRMSEAADIAQRASNTIEEASRRIAFLMEDGYGGNGLRLIELLKNAQDINNLRSLVERQLRWQHHRNSVGIPMSDAERMWVDDAERAMITGE